MKKFDKQLSIIGSVCFITVAPLFGYASYNGEQQDIKKSSHEISLSADECKKLTENYNEQSKDETLKGSLVRGCRAIQQDNKQNYTIRFF